MRRFKDFFNCKISAIINLLLWSLLLAVYLLYDRFNGSMDRYFILTYIYLFLSIIISTAILYCILKLFLAFFRYGGLIAYIISSVFITLMFVINNMTVVIYGKQLGAEGVVMSFRGWINGELGNPAAIFIKLIAFIVIYILIYYVTYSLLNRFLLDSFVGFNVLIGSFSVLILITIILHFSFVSLANTDWKMNLMKNKIPWQSMIGFPTDLVKVDEDGKRAGEFPRLFVNPDFLDEKTELEQLTKLNDAKEKILSQNINVKTPMNILFMNIEGLRSDMLNPVNMPFFYKFAKERGFILKKHYTTGNNTPGSLYGMLTGLAPYYFEPLRGNRFLNLSLHALKRAGYFQSFYYNSPMQYEYIHRDIIEKTQDRFVRAEGGNDNYSPREKVLIEKLISDLKNDKGIKRFDYYLMNVTHFNYYYPDECKKFLPDYTSHFTIISGTQEKFKKDRIELKNRYMNAVYYTDQLLRRLITEMDNMGKLKNTILVISGDHGEEFWEHGSFGHTWGLNNIQIMPAAIIYYPGITSSSIKYKYTSHQDFMPTVFELIGLNIDWNQFVTGKSLIHFNPDLDYAISSLGILMSFKRNGYAIIGNGYKILYKNNMDLNTSPYAIYADDDTPIENFDTYKIVDLLLKTKSSKRLKPAR
ncbi:MAG: sulfatase-like hydrolase/transferase [Spirochaetes bacterium]|nr:sulfatase-like hydrolase/transferase [Spirochaetota bacterium]